MRNTILNNYWYKETIKILIESMIFQGYKTSALISSPILTRCSSYFSTIKQLKSKTPEWKWRFTLEAIARNLIAFAFFIKFISNPLTQDLTLKCWWHHTTFQNIEGAKKYRKLIIEKQVDICSRCWFMTV